MRILVVEDTSDIAEAVVARLEAAGHAVDWGADASAATELLAVQTYDLMILNLNLPDEDGLTVLAKASRQDARPGHHGTFCRRRAHRRARSWGRRIPHEAISTTANSKRGRAHCCVAA